MEALGRVGDRAERAEVAAVVHLQRDTDEAVGVLHVWACEDRGRRVDGAVRAGPRQQRERLPSPDPEEVGPAKVDDTQELRLGVVVGDEDRAVGELLCEQVEDGRGCFAEVEKAACWLRSWGLGSSQSVVADRKGRVGRMLRTGRRSLH